MAAPGTIMHVMEVAAAVKTAIDEHAAITAALAAMAVSRETPPDVTAAGSSG